MHAGGQPGSARWMPVLSSDGSVDQGKLDLHDRPAARCISPRLDDRVDHREQPRG
jgi:hypothetical protein